MPENDTTLGLDRGQEAAREEAARRLEKMDRDHEATTLDLAREKAAERLEKKAAGWSTAAATMIAARPLDNAAAAEQVVKLATTMAILAGKRAIDLYGDCS